MSPEQTTEQGQQWHTIGPGGWWFCRCTDGWHRGAKHSAEQACDELNALEAELAQLRAKALLCDDTAMVFRRAKPTDVLWALDIPGWLDRYDALTPRQETHDE